ncbi:FABR138Cp [Eremothecium gossypii FDAG1]|nr:FABR138Cp [Eremothecium gossypii FDAG1]
MRWASVAAALRSASDIGRMALEDSEATHSTTGVQPDDATGPDREAQGAESSSTAAPEHIHTQNADGTQPGEGSAALVADGETVAAGLRAGAQWADETVTVELPEDVSEADCLSSDEEGLGATPAAAAMQTSAEQGGSDGGSAEQGGSDDSSSESSADEADAALSDAELDEEEDAPQGPVRSKNELVEEPLPEIPVDFVVESDTPILEIGTIKSAFDQNIIVQAMLSGEQRVLQEGSIFCLADRTVVGPVCEVFGKLSNPFYRVTFPKDAAEKFELFKNQLGAQVFLVQPKAHWLDTFEIKQVRGTDASNGVDEEVPEDEQEFSDDEAEAEFKRQKKLAKKRKAGNQDEKPRGKLSLEGRTGLPRMQVPSSLARASDRAPTYKPRSARQQRPVPPSHSRPQDQRASVAQPAHSAVPYAPLAAQPAPPVSYSQTAFPQATQPQMYPTSDPMAAPNQWYHNAAMQQVFHPAMMPQQYNPQQYAPPHFPQQYAGTYLPPQQYQEQLAPQPPVGQYNQAQLLQQLLLQQHNQNQQQQNQQNQQNQYPYPYNYQQHQPPH